MSCDSKEFLTLFFRELEQKAIPYVILHSYQALPEVYVPDWPALARLRSIQIELARKHEWAPVQTIQHGVFSFYFVLVNLNNPTESLKLDACSSYAPDRRFLVSERILLSQRTRHRGFYIPAPASEFIYELAKLFDTKGKSPAKYQPRLKALWIQDRPTAQQYFNDLFGDTGRSLEQWFDRPAEEWNRLRGVMLARNWFGPRLLFREGVRVVKRLFQPTGIWLAILGSDGAGKSTLLARLQTLLGPCFRYQRVLHSRPGVFQKRQTGAITDPHAKPPRNAVLSWLKVCYYFADYWAGWFLLILPGEIRSTLVICDRNFDDLQVDERRYRLSGTSFLVRLLRRLLPGADRTFVLSAPAHVLRQRKPELPVEELERQQHTLRQLAEGGARYVLVSAEEPPEQVAIDVCREVVRWLAAREKNRL